jgi:DNA polymerase III epsilon subunit family exonuclease
MQLQLALKLADRLHQALLVRGEPLSATAAVRLLAAADVSGPLCMEILEVLVQEDCRFCWVDSDRELLSLHNWVFPDPELSRVPFVALDLETTGACAGVGKITEIGAVRIEGFRAVEHFATLVNPRRPIPSMISRITGITQDMVADAPSIEEVMPSLLQFLEGAVLVAHNASFDVGFLNYELKRLQSRRLGEGAIDTLPLARALAPGLPSYRLHAVAEALGAPVTTCHRALPDAQAAGHVFVHLATLLIDRGLTRLGEMRAYGGPLGSSLLEKLSLTRDLPPLSGTYRFLDKGGQTLFVGRADHLAETVRSHFVESPRQNRNLRTALRVVEKIEWQDTHTPLEAVVREQQLLLEHRPPYNPHPTRPEGYTYIRVKHDGSGLSLFASQRPPKWLATDTGHPESGRCRLVIGPFRRRSVAQAAVDALWRCYPIKHCSREQRGRPCRRGELGLCLSPCAADLQGRQEHDALVVGLLCWLAGRSQPDLLDPLCRAEETAWTAARQGRCEEALALREASEHLLSVRRSCLALAEACELSFACLWPHYGNGDKPSVRMNIVWQGVLQEPLSLRPGSMEQQIDGALEPLRLLPVRSSKSDDKTLIAVPQKKLDSLLAVSRWFHDSDHPTKTIIPSDVTGPAALATTRAWLVTESQALLSM